MLEFEAENVRFRILGTSVSTERDENGKIIYHDLVKNLSTGEIKKVQASIVSPYLNLNETKKLKK